MRERWTETTLGEVAEWWSGGTPKAGEPRYYENGSIPWAVIADMNSGKIKKTATYITEEALVRIGGRVAPKGSVLISMYASVGKAAYAEIALATNQAIAWSIPNNALIMSEFLYLVAQSLEKTIADLARGATQRNVNRAMIRDFPFLLPPLYEQKRIVDLISSVDSYIDSLEQQAVSARKSRSAVLEELLATTNSYPKKTLKQVTSKIGSGATPRGGENVYIKNGISLIRSQNVHDSRFLFQGLVSIDENAANALNNASVEERDVLINITGASVTRCCLVDSSVLPARVNQHVTILRANQNILLPEYLVIAITSKKIKSFLNDIAGSGSTRQALTKNHLETLALHIPPIKRQYQIVEIISAMDLIIAASENLVSETKLLRSGLLSDLICGDHEIPESYDKVMGAA